MPLFPTQLKSSPILMFIDQPKAKAALEGCPTAPEACNSIQNGLTEFHASDVHPIECQCYKLLTLVYQDDSNNLSNITWCASRAVIVCESSPKSLAEASTCPLVVAQYRIDGHPRRTEHWNLVAIMSTGKKRIYELVGNYDSFLYDTQEVGDLDGSRLRGGCKVGQIPAKSLDWLATKLEDVRIVRNDPEFDCQTWVMDAIWLLKETATGIIDSHVNERFIREELKVEDEKWEAADDTLFERMF
jgi:hypothetical protein